jgi:hypothetical protein
MFGCCLVDIFALILANSEGSEKHGNKADRVDDDEDFSIWNDTRAAQLGHLPAVVFKSSVPARKTQPRKVTKAAAP